MSRLYVVSCLCLCSEIPVYLSVALELIPHNHKTNTNTATHSVDTATCTWFNCFVCHFFVCTYVNVFAVIGFSLDVIFDDCSMTSSKIRYCSVLVFTVREQALLPPDQKPLRNHGYINQLWPRSVPLIGRKAGVQREGFLHHQCFHTASACVCKWLCNYTMW